MKVLGILLAGGKSQRFGSDKAFAQYQGKGLIDHAIEALSNQCDDIIISGREYRGMVSITDNPFEGQGPLAGINAGFCYAQEYHYDALVSYPCDTICKQGYASTPWFTNNNKAQYIENQPVIGYWPLLFKPSLSQWMTQQKRRSMMAWADNIGADPIHHDHFQNINKPSDLADLADITSVQ